MFLLKRPIQALGLNLSSILVLGINWLGFKDLRHRPTCGLQKVSKGATLASQIEYRLIAQAHGQRNSKLPNRTLSPSPDYYLYVEHESNG